jgi:hypothetical protein
MHRFDVRIVQNEGKVSVRLLEVGYNECTYSNN